MSRSQEQILQLSIKFNLIIQDCVDEMRKGYFTNQMETFIKELLRVQEVLLSNPAKNLNLGTV